MFLLVLLSIKLIVAEFYRLLGCVVFPFLGKAWKRMAAHGEAPAVLSGLWVGKASSPGEAGSSEI